MKTTENLLHRVSTNIQVLREAKKRLAARYAPDFRLYDFMYSDENGLSFCLASLLQPGGKHGQGALYLKLLLKYLQPNWADSNVLSNSQVTVEKLTNQNRRIDIFIDIRDVGVIGIENKPWASDLPNQLDDYAVDLRSYSRPWLLVYFCNSEPAEISISRDKKEKYENKGNLKVLNFEQVNSWLKDCLNQTQPANLRFFIEEIMTFIEEKINSKIDMSEQHETINILLDKPEYLGAAFSIVNSVQVIKHRLLDKLRADLDACLNVEGMRLIWPEQGSHTNRYFKIRVDFAIDKSQDMMLTFEFQEPELNQFTWGIRKEFGNIPRDERWAKINNLMVERFGSGKTSVWWPWFTYPGQHFSKEYLNWKDNKEPWLAILDGSLAKEMCRVAGEVRDVFEDTDLLQAESVHVSIDID